MSRRPSAPEASHDALGSQVDAFLTYSAVERGLSRHTLEAYGHDLARLVDFLNERGEASVEGLRRENIVDFLAELEGRG
ncbi:MAG: site-specific integrase, partial [Deltaproteobacteria bacterium]|nr:site-specific integrase [Deltaproteobacteria bacterium]